MLTTHNLLVHGNQHRPGPLQLQSEPDVLRWLHALTEQRQEGKEPLSSIFYNA